jgi:predicted molibdopterin-dependent oxidoreductase YjgC
LPNVFPGYQPVADEAIRRKFAEGWSVAYERLASKPGLTVTEITHGVLGGRIKALYIMGENPMLSDPNLSHVSEAFDKVEFLVCQDIFLNETAMRADVVLPAASFAEKAGTFTNTERRVQLIRPALESPGESRADWKIILDVANRLGADWHYDGPAAIFDEMATVTPQYAGISHERLEAGGLQWPCPTVEHPGTPVLHVGKFTRGRGLFAPLEFKEPAELPDDEYPFLLSTGRILFHWHGGTMSRRSPGLDAIAPEAEAEIHPADALRLSIADGDLLRVFSRRGCVVAAAHVTPRSAPGMVFMTFHFAEAAVNLLTIDAVDPTAKIPEYKVCAVNIQKIAPLFEKELTNESESPFALA